MKLLRATSLAAGLIAGLLGSGTALAAPCVSDANFQGQPINSVLGAGTCTLQGGNVIFDLTAENIPSTAAAISFTDTAGGFSITVFPGGFLAVGPGSTGNITYTLTSLTGPLAGVRVDSTVSAGSPPVRVEKRIAEANLVLTSLNGSDSTAALPGVLVLTVTDAYTVDANAVNGSLSSFVNEFSVPEPASLALLGAGLVGLGMIRRRRAVA